jgi:FAD/FMN-containing dehydrogenase
MPSRREILTASAAATVTSALSYGATPQSKVPESARRVTEAARRYADRLEGRIVLPGEHDYDRLRRTASFNARFERSPQAIVECASAGDVQLALDFASNADLDVAVRAGGHDVLASSTTDGLIVDLHRLSSIEWQGPSVRVGAGVRTGQLSAATAQRDRVTPLGCNPAVGVSGLTLGGGLGWFIGTHGAACDAVSRATVVTASGNVLEASATQHPDLFWALRGGGGNFGIVTEWQYETYPISDLIAGTVVYPGASAREFLAFYRDFMAQCPDTVTVEIVALAHVQPIIAAMVVFTGSQADGAEVLKPLREFGPPLVDGLRSTSLREMGRMHPDVQPYFAWPNPTVDHERRSPGSYWQGVTVKALTDDVIDLIADAVADPPPGWSFGLGHVMRGAVTRVPEATSPFLRREGHTTVHFDGGWSYASFGDRLMRWIDRSIAELRGHAAHAEYVNYLSDDRPEAVRNAYGDHFAKLQNIKARYDPDNRLRNNRNIPPASAGINSPVG